MYSTAGGRPGGRGGGGKQQGRYVKGRLPEGVDFAAYPGRSSTPLPTAESKSAERINQLKIWNEAATNQDKRLLTPKSKDGEPTGRRTDSFKEARDRHSASFQAPVSPPVPGAGAATAAQRQAARNAPNADIYADRSDDDEEEEYDDNDATTTAPAPASAPTPATTTTENKLPAHLLPAQTQAHVPAPTPTQMERQYRHEEAGMGVGAGHLGMSNTGIAEEYSGVQNGVPSTSTSAVPNGHGSRAPKQSGGCCVLV